MADKPHRAIIFYGDGLLMDLDHRWLGATSLDEARCPGLHSIAKDGASGFLALRDAAEIAAEGRGGSGSEHARVVYELAQLLDLHDHYSPQMAAADAHPPLPLPASGSAGEEQQEEPPAAAAAAAATAAAAAAAGGNKDDKTLLPSLADRFMNMTGFMHTNCAPAASLGRRAGCHVTLLRPSTPPLSAGGATQEPPAIPAGSSKEQGGGSGAGGPGVTIAGAGAGGSADRGRSGGGEGRGSQGEGSLPLPPPSEYAEALMALLGLDKQEEAGPPPSAAARLEGEFDLGFVHVHIDELVAHHAASGAAEQGQSRGGGKGNEEREGGGGSAAGAAAAAPAAGGGGKADSALSGRGHLASGTLGGEGARAGAAGLEEDAEAMKGFLEVGRRHGAEAKARGESGSLPGSALDLGGGRSGRQDDEPEQTAKRARTTTTMAAGQTAGAGAADASEAEMELEIATAVDLELGAGAGTDVRLGMETDPVTGAGTGGRAGEGAGARPGPDVEGERAADAPGEGAAGGDDDVVARLWAAVRGLEWLSDVVAALRQKSAAQPMETGRARSHMLCVLLLGYGRQGGREGASMAPHSLPGERRGTVGPGWEALQAAEGTLPHALAHLRPPQSYQMKANKLVPDVREHHPILAAYHLEAVTRRDAAGFLGVQECRKHGGNGAILANRFLHEVAFKLWRAPKYGA